MAKGDGFKRDWRCSLCGTYNEGHRLTCRDTKCIYRRNPIPEGNPVRDLPDHAREEDAEDQREEEYQRRRRR